MGGLTFFLICIVGGGVQTGTTRHVGHLLAHGWEDNVRVNLNEIKIRTGYM
jgi:hypothetical protein